MVRRGTYPIVAILLLLASEGLGQMIQQCAGCERVLFGEYIQVDGRNYHTTCFTCAECNKPIDQRFYSHHSRYFHLQCYDKKFCSPCSVCGQLLKDRFCEDYWGGRYCAGHQDSIPPCDFCSRLITGPITGKGLQLPDGRRLCGVCRPSAVTNEYRAKVLMCEVATIMKSLGLMIDCTKMTILLLGQEELKRLIPDPRHAPLGFTEYITVSNEESKVNIKSFNILLLYGMPAVQTKAVLAHELMHVWLFNHGISDIDVALCEGSCNFASYLFLKAVGSVECNYIIREMINDLDPVYGRGFRDVKQYVETNGVTVWLHMLRE